MRTKTTYMLGGILTALVLLSGCAKDQAVVAKKAATPTQQDFYNIQALYEKGKYEQAITDGQAFLDNNSQHLFSEAVRYYMGSSAQKLGRTDEAKSHFEKLIQDNPKGNWAQLAKFNLEEMGVGVSTASVTVEGTNPDQAEQTVEVFEEAGTTTPAEANNPEDSPELSESTEQQESGSSDVQGIGEEDQLSDPTSPL